MTRKQKLTLASIIFFIVASFFSFSEFEGVGLAKVITLYFSGVGAGASLVGLICQVKSQKQV